MSKYVEPETIVYIAIKCIVLVILYRYYVDQEKVIKVNGNMQHIELNLKHPLVFHRFLSTIMQ